MEKITESKIALLIDADNAQAKHVKNILAEASIQGKVTIRRIYGDWTDNRLSLWKEEINTHSIRPVQKFSLAKGKNSTDTAMIIDAMDILHSKNVTGFCIASSDSDYTGLAQRIREEGIFVMGIGEANKTSSAFVNACDLFVFTENLSVDTHTNSYKGALLGTNEFSPAESDAANIPAKSKQKTQQPAPPSKAVKHPTKISEKIELPINKITKKPIDVGSIHRAFAMVVDDSGLAYMSEMGTALRKLDPSFDCRTYGSATLANLLKRLPNLFELIYKNNDSSLYLKLKSKSEKIHGS